jgi:hypothetical protein
MLAILIFELEVSLFVPSNLGLLCRKRLVTPLYVRVALAGGPLKHPLGFRSFVRDAHFLVSVSLFQASHLRCSFLG